MKAAIDVAYQGSRGVAACVLFDAWDAPKPSAEFVAEVDPVADYEAGQFYRRELPCLLAVLERVKPNPSMVLVDGHVWLDDPSATSGQSPGLGALLFAALGERAPVIGVAKSAFKGSSAAERIVRGQSERPLFVTAVGTDPKRAAYRVASMAGAYRLPTLLKRADSLAREAV